MTTAFQTAINYAESISINKRKKVSQTTSRDGTVKSTSLGGQVWEFEVKMPDGISWTTMRPLIEKMETLDRVTVGQIKINSAGHSWLSQYQGNLSNPNGVVVSYVSGNVLSIIGGGTLGSGFKFRAGDFIQLGSGGSVYSVAEDVPYTSNTIQVNRPIREVASNYTLIVGQNVTWNVLCVSFPKWTIFARDQVSWDSPFVFVEAI